MRGSYLLRNYRFLLRYALLVLLVQVLGWMGFAVLSAVLIGAGKFAFWLPLILAGVLVYTVGSCFLIFRRDIGLIENMMFPVDNKSDAIERLNELLILSENSVKRWESLKWRAERLLVENVQLKKRAEAHRNMEIVKRAGENNAKILRLRAEINSSLQPLKMVPAICNEGITEIEAGQDYRLVLRVRNSDLRHLWDRMDALHAAQRREAKIRSGEAALRVALT